MLFKEAMDALMEGKFVTRLGWLGADASAYLALLPGMQYIWKVSTIPNPAAGNWLPMTADLLADDWQINGVAEAPVPPATEVTIAVAA